MLLAHEDQTVDFDVEYIKSFEKIGVSVSGGTDSALLFYLICKFVPDVSILPWSANDIYRPTNLDAARSVYDAIKNHFPDREIKPMYEFDIDTKDPYWRRFSRENYKNTYNLSIGGFTKNSIISHKTELLYETDEVRMHINGLTANPPEEIVKQLGIENITEKRRYSKDNETKLKTMYKPFRNVDKKWVAGMYERFELMDWIYPLTQSCTGFAQETNFFTEPCKECFWCNEKKWAFGTYDLCFDINYD